MTETLLEEIIRILNKGESVRETPNGLSEQFEITTAYLDKHNDYIQIYAQKDSIHGDFLLTDDGYAVRELQMSVLGNDKLWSLPNWIEENITVKTGVKRNPVHGDLFIRAEGLGDMRDKIDRLVNAIKKLKTFEKNFKRLSPEIEKSSNLDGESK